MQEWPTGRDGCLYRTTFECERGHGPVKKEIISSHSISSSPHTDHRRGIGDEAANDQHNDSNRQSAILKFALGCFALGVLAKDGLDLYKIINLARCYLNKLCRRHCGVEAQQWAWYTRRICLVKAISGDALID